MGWPGCRLLLLREQERSCSGCKGSMPQRRDRAGVGVGALA